MSLPIVLLIMVLTGVLGGMLNHALQSNLGGIVAAVQPLRRCILIGIGATILIPLFLEIAQSKLLDKMHTCLSLGIVDHCGTKPGVITKGDKKDQNAVSRAEAKENNPIDTVGNAKRKADSLAMVAKKAKTKIAEAAEAEKSTRDAEQSNLKNYLLYAAYCLLAAAAGPRFINGLLDGVLKDKQISTLAKEKKVVTEEKDKAVEEKEKVVEERNEIEKVKTKLAAQNHLEAKKDEENIIIKSTEGIIVKTVAEGALEAAAGGNVDGLNAFHPGPIIHNDDPQKGRFGGKSEQNGRVLRANVGKENSYGFFKVTFWVESPNSDEPLQDVRFFLHDSFRPSVYLIKNEEFKEGKAMDQIEAYGAFTVGAVTDNGNTLLELDLAEQKEFPKEFRER